MNRGQHDACNAGLWVNATPQAYVHDKVMVSCISYKVIHFKQMRFVKETPAGLGVAVLPHQGQELDSLVSDKGQFLAIQLHVQL